jgi:hypothetical protein
LFRQSQSHGALIFTQVARDDKSAIRAARWADLRSVALFFKSGNMLAVFVPAMSV